MDFGTLVMFGGLHPAGMALLLGGLVWIVGRTWLPR